jgi:hypothetical protein
MSNTLSQLHLLFVTIASSPNDDLLRLQNRLSPGPEMSGRIQEAAFSDPAGVPEGLGKPYVR